MAKSTWRSLRKVSGGRYHYFRTKRSRELAGTSSDTHLNPQIKTITKRGRGGHDRTVLLTTNHVSVATKEGKTATTEILNVLENPANANLVRRNIITKGAMVETKLGRVRITSRPGQEGSLNGVLL